MVTLLTLCALVGRSVLPLAACANPLEIDLAPLPGTGANVKYELHLALNFADGSKFAQGYKVGANNAPSDVAQLILESLPKGFDATLDGAKLTIKSFNGAAVTTIRLEVDGLPKGSDPPKVQRVYRK